jgi:hypothetical protein
MVSAASAFLLALDLQVVSGRRNTDEKDGEKHERVLSLDCCFEASSQSRVIPLKKCFLEVVV